MSAGSDSGVHRAIPKNLEDMVREMYQDLSVSRPNRPCVIEMLSRGQERMARQDEEIERLRELQNGHDAAIASVNRALELHCMMPTEKPLRVQLGVAFLVAMVSVIGAAIPVALFWGLVWQSSQAMHAFETVDHYTPQGGPR